MSIENQSHPTSNRSLVADLAKGIAVLCMIQVHIAELFLNHVSLTHQYAQKTPTVMQVLLFLGGPPAAPVFMVLLGYFTLHSQRSLRFLLLRGCGLIGLGLALNFGMNTHLLYKISQGTLQLSPWPFILGADILPLAGMSVILLSVLRRLLPRHSLIYLLMAAGCAFGSPVLLQLLTTDSPAKWGLALLGGSYAWSYFPLLPWFAYPLLGAAVALVPRSRMDVLLCRPRLVALAALCILASLILTLPRIMPIVTTLSNYYHHGPGLFLWLLGFLIFWFSTLHLFSKTQHTPHCTGALAWLGQHVTLAYCVQWILIGNLATEIYKTQTLSECLVWFAVISLATYALTLLLQTLWQRSST